MTNNSQCIEYRVNNVFNRIFSAPSWEFSKATGSPTHKHTQTSQHRTTRDRTDRDNDDDETPCHEHCHLPLRGRAKVFEPQPNAQQRDQKQHEADQENQNDCDGCMHGIAVPKEEKEHSVLDTHITHSEPTQHQWESEQ